MKVCSECNIPKEETDFNRRKKKCRSYLYGICKKCNQKLSLKSRIRNRQFIHEYLKTHSCIDCPEKDIVALEFDHVRGKKIKAVARMAQDAFSLESIIEEIAKCDVRCSNCHKKRHAKLRNPQLASSG